MKALLILDNHYFQNCRWEPWKAEQIRLDFIRFIQSAIKHPQRDFVLKNVSQVLRWLTSEAISQTLISHFIQFTVFLLCCTKHLHLYNISLRSPCLLTVESGMSVCRAFLIIVATFCVIKAIFLATENAINAFCFHFFINHYPTAFKCMTQSSSGVLFTYICCTRGANLIVEARMYTLQGVTKVRNRKCLPGFIVFS